MVANDTDPEHLAADVADALADAAAGIEPRPDAYTRLVTRVELASTGRRWHPWTPSRLALGAALASLAVAAVAVATPLVDLGRGVEQVAGPGGAARAVGTMTRPSTSTSAPPAPSSTFLPSDQAAQEAAERLAGLVFALLAVAADPELADEQLPVDDGTTVTVTADGELTEVPGSSLLTPSGWRQPLALPPPGGGTKGGGDDGQGPSLADLLAVPAPESDGSAPDWSVAFTVGSQMEGFTPVPEVGPKVEVPYTGSHGWDRTVRFGFETDGDDYRLASIDIRSTP